MKSIQEALQVNKKSLFHSIKRMFPFQHQEDIQAITDLVIKLHIKNGNIVKEAKIDIPAEYKRDLYMKKNNIKYTGKKSPSYTFNKNDTILYNGKPAIITKIEKDISDRIWYNLYY